ncbi:MAG: MgtC/SapB family protein [Kiritimatiellaeota bacterium]|nr:MgtC/SapB family protein [Kiritimatiellota bacterium]
MIPLSSLSTLVQSCNPVFLKLGCALLAGLVLGLEREYNGHAAGLRTTLLVCLAPALAVLMCGAMTDSSAMGRVVQGLFAGVGFIGGGVILKHGETDTVRGVTTAAVLWMATTLGIVFGLGLYALGFAGLGAAVLIVYALAPVTRLFHTRHHATLTVTASSGAFTAQQGAELLTRLNLKAAIAAFDFNTGTGVNTYRFTLEYRRRDTQKLPALVRESLATLPGILQVHWN